MTKSAAKAQSGIWATVVGFVTLFVGASGVFGQLKDSLNTIWEVKPKGGAGVMGFLRERLLSFSMVLVIGFLLLISLVLATAISGFSSKLGLPSSGWFSALVGFALPLAVEVALFSTIFKVLPDAKVEWQHVWKGALVTALLFELGKWLLSFYLTENTASAYGAVGSIVVLLLWIYYASCILFFGAEFTQAYAHAIGHDIQPADNALPVTAEARAQQGLAPGGKAEPEPAPAELHPLSPIGPTPAAPKKESVAELMPPPEPVVTREQIRRSVRRSQMPPWRVKVEDWLEQAHEHPFAEVGAAVGIGLIAGLASRMVHRRPEEVSPKEHLQLGAKGLATAGASAFVALRPWIKKRLSAKALHHAAEMVQKRASRLARG